MEDTRPPQDIVMKHEDKADVPISMNSNNPTSSERNDNLKTESEPLECPSSSNADENDEQSQSDEADEEEEMLNNLDKNQNEEFDRNTHQDATIAPTLLKAALETGKIEEDESSSSGEEKKTTESKNRADDMRATKRPNKVNQLDFLLSKAAEYSNFIASDLEELQKSMSDQAAAEMAAVEASGSGKKGKKRKRSKKESNSNNALAEAQAKNKSNPNIPPIFIQPKNLANGCILKDYQLEGVRWLTSLYENGVSGILADEMGLGKTIQVIGVIAHLRTMGVPGPFLVVAPLATLPNWVREFEKWLPAVEVVRYHGSPEVRKQLMKTSLNPKLRKTPAFPIIVTSYEVSIKDMSQLQKIGEFTYLIVDEGQRLKNHRCSLIRSLKAIPASNRLLLSGTPIQNNLDELWSLLNFVNPQIFDDLSVFQSWFGFRDIGSSKQGGTSEDDILAEQQQNSTVTKLHEILRPFLLRRIKRDVLTDLPPKKEVVIYSGMSKLQSGYADLIEKGTIRQILMNQGISGASKLSQTNKQMNHRKNSNHPFLFGEPIDSVSGLHLGTAHPQLLVRASGKFALLDRMLTSLWEDKHQVLIFSQMTGVLNVMEDYLMWRRWKYCRIDGSTKIDDRQKQMDVFNAEKTSGADGGRNESDERMFVFLLSTRAGGLGINLTAADTCIIFDSDWNPHQDSQAMDRCHRIGQTRPVAVYRLLTAGSVDIEMMEKQISKKKLERMAIVGGDFRKAGARSKGAFSAKALSSLLEDDIEDLQAKAGGIEDIAIDEVELDQILDRKKLFGEGDKGIPSEGKMYDVLDATGGDLLGAMTG